MAVGVVANPSTPTIRPGGHLVSPMLGIPLALIWVALVAVAAWVWVAEWVEVKEVAGEEDWVPLPPGYALPMMIATMIYDLLPRYDVNVAELVVEGVVVGGLVFLLQAKLRIVDRNITALTCTNL